VIPLDSMAWAIVRVIIFLPLVIGLIFLSLKYGLGKNGQNSGFSQMRIADRIYLGPKSALYVVQVAEQYFLLASTEKQITILKELAEYPCIESFPKFEFSVKGVLSEIQKTMAIKFGNRG